MTTPSQQPFHRLAIVNRGEPAMRAIHAVRELNAERTEADSIAVIALYTESEQHALFVRQADERHCLGPATVVDDDGRRRSGYLDYAALERALVETQADAAWVGWGFVAEHPEFAELCERLGIVFVGPEPQTMRSLGDKIEAKLLAERAGVPVAPWSGGPVETVDDAIRHGKELGFPLMIKAAAGGGGRGMRRVERAEELPSAFDRARAEAEQSFGDPSVLIERLVGAARHVEVQLVADGQGGVWALGVRDCTCQRRHQKVVEESASPALSAEQERELAASAARLAKLAGYRGAGTVEFLYEPSEQAFSFMEVNTRLQVEHPVTEAVTGVDIVKLQLHIAAGGRLEGDPPPARGHAIEVRLNAEDPALGFAPAPGRVTLLRLPAGPGVRVDSGIAEGDLIPPDFDSMIAKIIAHGPTRDAALARLRRAVADTVVVIEDGATNQGFLLELLDRPELREGTMDTAWLDRLQAEGDLSSPMHADTALLRAAIALYESAKTADRARFYAFARRGRPQAEAPVQQAIDLRYGGASYRFEVCQISPSRYRIEVDGTSIEAEIERISEHESRISYGGRSFRTLIAMQNTDLLVEVAGVPHRVSRDEVGMVRSHAPAVVVAIPVSVGDEVQAGDVVAVTESMKMESSLVAPVGGRVREVLVSANVHVGPGRPLVQIEPLDDGADVAGGDRLTFDAGDPGDPDADRIPALTGLERLTWLVLGYDVTADEARRIVDEVLDETLDHDAERRLLEAYADVRALNRPHPAGTPEARVLGSPQERLHAFLRTLDAEAEGLPERFVANLERALGHYGIDGLDRTPALEDACYRLFLAQQRAGSARPAVQKILARHLELAPPAMQADGELRGALDRLETALAPREPAVAEQARELRWRCFDQPLIDAAREETYVEMQRHLSALAAGPESAARAEHLQPLIDCPQPLMPLLGRCAADPSTGLALVEALTQRYYRIRDVQPAEVHTSGDTGLLVAGYEHESVRHRVIAALAGPDGVAAALKALAAEAGRVPDGECVLVDLYVVGDGSPRTQDELAAELEGLLKATPLPAPVGRVTFSVAAGPDLENDAAAVISYAINGSVSELRGMRGLHPMMAERLDLWRLSNFNLERQQSSPDVFLFRAVAHENPRDERVVAVAEVRDLTPVRDEAGTITALPELERMTRQGLEAIRTAQGRRPPRDRPQWNRLILYAWPTMEFEPDEARPVIDRLARLTAGLGLEMVQLRVRLRDEDGSEHTRLLRFFNPAGRGVVMEVGDPPTEPLQPLDEGAQRIVSARRRGLLHPAEIVKILAPERAAPGAAIPAGKFTEYDLGADDQLVAVDRPPATNTAGIVVGLVRTRTERYPEGMLRVVLLGDPTRGLGALAEQECRRIIAALDLAERLGVPCEWFALSSGAKIAMDSGTENMDWVAAALRRIVNFTQAGGEINLVVNGINVGAQPYFNAEATMLMHTKGVLIMTPQGAMVLTGKDALDYSGGVSAEDNFGIGGYERIMGPNGQAQYWAPDLTAACETLLAYYDRTYVAAGERFPRRAPTDDPLDRDVCESPHLAPESDLQTIGEIFSEQTNPGRKKPFDIRAVMRAVTDSDRQPLERWQGMREAEVAVVWDTYLGGWPVAVLGIQSRPLSRFGVVPADGPEQWTSGTLFPVASKKMARAINAASGRRPLVILANLAGFDGSPESMRRLQLEYGAEIGRAIVNFDGPIAFCVISRFHGGAFVVFSRSLNENLETSALEGAHASVIGGAPAAAVVFARDVDVRTRTDPRIAELDERIASAGGPDRDGLRTERAALWSEVRSEKLGELAAEFDATHSVRRAVEVGSVDRIVSASGLRPYLIDAVERGMGRTLGGALPVASVVA